MTPNDPGRRAVGGAPLDKYLEANLPQLIEEYLDALRATAPGDHEPKRRLVSQPTTSNSGAGSVRPLAGPLQRGDRKPDWPLAFHSAIEMLRLEFSR
jgi:hypothetical protein